MKYFYILTLLALTSCAHLRPKSVIAPAAVSTAAVQSNLKDTKSSLESSLKGNEALGVGNTKAQALNEAAVLSIKQAIELLDKAEKEQK